MEEESQKKRRLDDVAGEAILPPPPPTLQGQIGLSGGLSDSILPTSLQNPCLPGALLAGALPGFGLPTTGLSLPFGTLPGLGMHSGSLPSGAISGGPLFGATSLTTDGLVGGGLPGAGMLSGIAGIGNSDQTMINGGLIGNMMPSGMGLPSAGVPTFAPNLGGPTNNSLAQLATNLGGPTNNSLAQLQAQIQVMSGGGAMDPAQQEMIIKMAMEMRSKMPKKKKGEKGRAELEKMMAMMQSNQQAPQTAEASIPESEQELVKMQIETGMNPMKTIADSSASQTIGIGSSGGDQITGTKIQALDSSTQLEEVADPSCDLLMYALAQVAEDAAQQTLSRASLCSSQEAADPTQVQAMAESAQQASQKASWAAQAMETYEPPPIVRAGWVTTMRQIGRAAAEAAQYAAEQSMKLANKLAGIDEDADDDGKGDGKRGGKVPCKFFLLGKCWKGEGCEFAHEKPELKPRPLMLKREEECIYYARGQCTRGVACPFAHGPEELAEISKYVVTLKKEKQQQMRQRRN